MQYCWYFFSFHIKLFQIYNFPDDSREMVAREDSRDDQHGYVEYKRDIASDDNDKYCPKCGKKYPPS